MPSIVNDDAWIDLAELPRPPRWARYGACTGPLPPGATFFPEAGETAAAAIAICRGCAVRIECLEYAFTTATTEGVWGGTTPDARRDLRRAWLAGATVTGEWLDQLERDREAEREREAVERRERYEVALSASGYDGPLCTGCGGLLSKKDLVEADGWCWACRPG